MPYWIFILFWIVCFVFVLLSGFKHHGLYMNVKQHVKMALIIATGLTGLLLLNYFITHQLYDIN